MSVYNTDKIAKKQTLEPLTPRILGPFLPTNWEKNQIDLGTRIKDFGFVKLKTNE